MASSNHVLYIYAYKLEPCTVIIFFQIYTQVTLQPEKKERWKDYVEKLDQGSGRKAPYINKYDITRW